LRAAAAANRAYGQAFGKPGQPSVISAVSTPAAGNADVIKTGLLEAAALAKTANVPAVPNVLSGNTDQPSSQNDMSLRDAAVAFARDGFRVFPAHTIRNGACTCGGAKGCSPGKHPIGGLVPRGVLNASSDPDVVTRWWGEVPDANIGIATGSGSNLVVLDVDGPVGEATLAEIEYTYGSLPPTRQVKTGKGRHLYFRRPTGATKIKSIARKPLGLDVRADGGYVIAPPSIHESGHRYVLDCASELAECPPWVVEYANGQLKIDGARVGSGGEGIVNLDAFKNQRPPELLSSLNSQEDSLADGIRANKTPPPFSEAEEARVRSALAVIRADERDVWRDIGFALHSLAWGDQGFKIWSDWSRSCPEKYDEVDQRKTWEGFDRPYHGARITAATIFYKAGQLGWIDEKRDFHTDLGNARRLVDRHGDNVRFIPEWRKWIVWQKGRWELDMDGAVMRLAKATVEAMYTEALALTKEQDRAALLRHALRSQAEARLKAMVALAETEVVVVVPASKLDADPWVLGVENGVIDLRTGTFRQARREDLITKRANVSFDPTASCPNWLKFLDTVTGSNPDLQAYVRRVVGYTLTGSVGEEVLFVLYGTGSNGKSTFRETLHAILGDYALAADAALLTERKKQGGATEEIARLKGRRLVAVNETAENDHLNEARVKFITSQDTISARNLYGHLFDFFPSHKAFLSTNHKPIVRGTDEGIWRRVQLIPFLVTIAKTAVEKNFRERRLMPEFPGILNWALAGLADYLRQGLNPPKTVLASTEDYRNDMDVIGQWLDECCDQDPSASIPTSLAHADYSRWAQDEVGWTLSKLAFRRNLADRGFGAKKGSGGRRMVQGLRLKSFTCPQPPVGTGVLGKLNDGRSVRADAVLLEKLKAHPDISERAKELLGEPR
jgi:putative DNA primase/helicase